MFVVVCVKNMADHKQHVVEKGNASLSWMHLRQLSQNSKTEIQGDYTRPSGRKKRMSTNVLDAAEEKH